MRRSSADGIEPRGKLFPFVHFLSSPEGGREGGGKLHNTPPTSTSTSPPRTSTYISCVTIARDERYRLASRFLLSLSLSSLLSFFPSPPARVVSTRTFISSYRVVSTSKGRRGGWKRAREFRRELNTTKCLFRRGCIRWGNARMKGLWSDSGLAAAIFSANGGQRGGRDASARSEGRAWRKIEERTE